MGSKSRSRTYNANNVSGYKMHIWCPRPLIYMEEKEALIKSYSASHDNTITYNTTRAKNTTLYYIINIFMRGKNQNYY